MSVIGLIGANGTKNGPSSKRGMTRCSWTTPLQVVIFLVGSFEGIRMVFA